MRPGIPFNKAHLTGKESEYIQEAVSSLKLSGNGIFTQRCHTLLEEQYGFGKCLLTTSGTDALEMAAILCNLSAGDEVIVPSYTFVSTANAFILRGAKIIFCDSSENTPNIDVTQLESLITPRTRVIVVVHYAGIACDMDKVLEIAKKHNLLIVEDAAHSIDSTYKGKPLGSIGDFAAFSFHETKNISCGEGGMLVVNRKEHFARAEIIWEKGTNRSAFARGEIKKYEWIDIGSSFLPSEITAAFLFTQLENLEMIQRRRCAIWDRYLTLLSPLARDGLLKLPYIPNYAKQNGHLFYILASDIQERDAIIQWLKERGIHSVFHYICLHSSPYFSDQHGGRTLENAFNFSQTLIRLPLFFDLKDEEVSYIGEQLISFYQSKL